MSKYAVATSGAGKVEADQLATFAHYIKQVQFRFIVTQMPGAWLPDVTHRGSGKRVCAITHADLVASGNDAKKAGVAALERLISRVGADKAYDVLRSAEIEEKP